MTKTIFATLLLTFTCLFGQMTPKAFAEPLTVTGDISLQISTEMEAGNYGAFVTVTLPEDTQLPAVVQVPVPPNLHPHWVGEIVDAKDASKDITITEGDYVSGKTAEGAPYIQVTVTKSHIVQIEGIIGALVSDGSDTTFSTSFTNFWSETKPLVLSLVIPANTALISSTPSSVSQPQTGSKGQQLYTLATSEIKSGETIDIEASYETSSSAVAANAKQNVNPAIIAIGIVAVIGVIVLVILLVNKKRNEPEYY